MGNCAGEVHLGSLFKSLLLEIQSRKRKIHVDVLSRIDLENIKKAMHLEKETRYIVQDEIEEMKMTSIDIEAASSSLRTEFGEGSMYDKRISEIESNLELLKNDALEITSEAYNRRLKEVEEDFTIRYDELERQLKNFYVINIGD